MVEGAAVTWSQGFLSYLHPLLLWHWLVGSHSWFYRLYRNIKSGFDPRFRRRRRLLSWVEQAAGRDVLDLAMVWRDGSILCEVIHRACPTACQGWEESQSKDTFRHAQALVYRCLQLDPAFSEAELSRVELTPNIEKRLFRYVQAIKLAISKRHHTRSLEEESDGEPLIAEEYIARGMGLIMASRRQPAIFYIYSRDGSSLMDIHIEIRGPGDDFGSALVSQMDGDIPGDCSIPIEYKVTPEYLRVSYQPRSVGHHELSVSRHGYIVPGSPFVVTVDEITERQPNKRFNSIEWFTEDEERRQQELQEKKNITKVKLRVVDFVTEKMILTEDGKLVKISPDVQGCASPPPPNFPAPSLPQLPNSLEPPPSISTSPTRSFESHSSSGRSRRSISPKSRNKRPNKCKWINSKPDAMKYIVVKPQKAEIKTVSDVASQVTLEIQNSAFQDKCKRIVNVCNYLLRHCPRQKSLDIISGAGHILQTGMPKKNSVCKIKKDPVSVTEVSDEDDEVFVSSPASCPTVKTIMCPTRCRSISMSFVNDKLTDSTENVAESTSSDRLGSQDSGHLASAARRSFRCEGNTKSPQRRTSFSSIAVQNDDSSFNCTEDVNRCDTMRIGSNIHSSGDATNKSETTLVSYSQLEEDVLQIVKTTQERTEPQINMIPISAQSKTKIEKGNNCPLLPSSVCAEEYIFSNMHVNNLENKTRFNNSSKYNLTTQCLRPEFNKDDDESNTKEPIAKIDTYASEPQRNDTSKPIHYKTTSKLSQVENKIVKRVPTTKGNLVKRIIAHFEASVGNEIEKIESVHQETPTAYRESHHKPTKPESKCYVVSVNKIEAVKEKVMQIEDELQIEYLKSIGASVQCISTVKPKIEMFENSVLKKDSVVSSKQRIAVDKSGRIPTDTPLLESMKKPLLEHTREHVFRAEPAIVVSKHYAELREISLNKTKATETVIFDFKPDPCVGSQTIVESEEKDFDGLKVKTKPLNDCSNVAKDSHTTFKESLNNEPSSDETAKYEPTVVALVTEVPKDPDKQNEWTVQTDNKEHNYSTCDNTVQNINVDKPLSETDNVLDDTDRKNTNDNQVDKKLKGSSDLELQNWVSDTIPTSSQQSDMGELINKHNETKKYNEEISSKFEKKDGRSKGFKLSKINLSQNEISENETSLQTLIDKPCEQIIIREYKETSINNVTDKICNQQLKTDDVTVEDNETFIYNKTAITNPDNILREETSTTLNMVNVGTSEKTLRPDDVLGKDTETTTIVKQLPSDVDLREDTDDFSNSISINNVFVEIFEQQSPPVDVLGEYKDISSNNVNEKTCEQQFTSDVALGEGTDTSINNVFEDTFKQQLPPVNVLGEDSDTSIKNVFEDTFKQQLPADDVLREDEDVSSITVKEKSCEQQCPYGVAFPPEDVLGEDKDISSNNVNEKPCEQQLPSNVALVEENETSCNIMNKETIKRQLPSDDILRTHTDSSINIENKKTCQQQLPTGNVLGKEKESSTNMVNEETCEQQLPSKDMVGKDYKESSMNVENRESCEQQLPSDSVLGKQTDTSINIVNKKTCQQQLRSDDVLGNEKETSTIMMNVKTCQQQLPSDDVLGKDTDKAINIVNEKTCQQPLPSDDMLGKDTEISINIVNEETCEQQLSSNDVVGKDYQESCMNVVNEESCEQQLPSDDLLGKDTETSISYVNKESCQQQLPSKAVVGKDYKESCMNVVNEESCEQQLLSDDVVIKDTETTINIVNEQTCEQQVPTLDVFRENTETSINIVNEETCKGQLPSDDVIGKDTETSINIVNEETCKQQLPSDDVLGKDTETSINIVNEETCDQQLTSDDVIDKDTETSINIVNEETCKQHLPSDDVIAKYTETSINIVNEETCKQQLPSDDLLGKDTETSINIVNEETCKQQLPSDDVLGKDTETSINIVNEETCKQQLLSDDVLGKDIETSLNIVNEETCKQQLPSDDVLAKDTETPINIVNEETRKQQLPSDDVLGKDTETTINIVNEETCKQQLPSDDVLAKDTETPINIVNEETRKQQLPSDDVLGKDTETSINIVNEETCDQQLPCDDVIAKYTETSINIVNEETCEQQLPCDDVLGKDTETFINIVNEETCEQQLPSDDVIGKDTETPINIVSEETYDQQLPCDDVLSKDTETSINIVNEGTCNQQLPCDDVLGKDTETSINIANEETCERQLPSDDVLSKDTEPINIGNEETCDQQLPSDDVLGKDTETPVNIVNVETCDHSLPSDNVLDKDTETPINIVNEETCDIQLPSDDVLGKDTETSINIVNEETCEQQVPSDDVLGKGTETSVNIANEETCIQQLPSDDVLGKYTETSINIVNEETCDQQLPSDDVLGKDTETSIKIVSEETYDQQLPCDDVLSKETETSINIVNEGTCDQQLLCDDVLGKDTETSINIVNEETCEQQLSSDDVIGKDTETSIIIVNEETCDQQLPCDDVIAKYTETSINIVNEETCEQQLPCDDVLGKDTETFINIVNEETCEQQLPSDDVIGKDTETPINIVSEETYDQLLPCDDVLSKDTETSINIVNEGTRDQQLPCDDVLGKDTETSINIANEETCERQLPSDDVLSKDTETPINIVNEETCDQQLPSDDVLGKDTETPVNIVNVETCDHSLPSDNVLDKDTETPINIVNEETCDIQLPSDDVLGKYTETSINIVNEETCEQQVPSDDVLAKDTETPINIVNEETRKQQLPSDDVLGKDTETSINIVNEETCKQQLPSDDVLAKDTETPINIVNEETRKQQLPSDDVLGKDTETSINIANGETFVRQLTSDCVLGKDTETSTTIEKEETCQQKLFSDDILGRDTETSISIMNKETCQQPLTSEDVLGKGTITSVNIVNEEICQQQLPSDDMLEKDTETSVNIVSEEICQQQLPSKDVLRKDTETSINIVNEETCEQQMSPDHFLVADMDKASNIVQKETIDQLLLYNDVVLEETSISDVNEKACELQLPHDDLLGKDTEISINNVMEECRDQKLCANVMLAGDQETSENITVKDTCDQHLYHDDELVEDNETSINYCKEITCEHLSDHILRGDTEISINKVIEETCDHQLFQDDAIEEDKETSIKVKETDCDQQLPYGDVLGGVTEISMSNAIEEPCDQQISLPHVGVLARELKETYIDNMNEITCDQPSDDILGGATDIAINKLIEETCTQNLFQDDALEEDKATSITVRDRDCEQQLPCDDMLGGATVTSMNNTIENTCGHQLRHDDALVEEDKDIFISNEDKETCKQPFDDILVVTEISINKVVGENYDQQLSLPHDDVFVELKETSIDNENEMTCDLPLDDIFGEHTEISINNVIEETCDPQLGSPHEDFLAEPKETSVDNTNEMVCEHPSNDMLGGGDSEISLNKVIEETYDPQLSLPHENTLVELKKTSIDNANEVTFEPSDDMLGEDTEISISNAIEESCDQPLSLPHEDVLVEDKYMFISNEDKTSCEQPFDDMFVGDTEISLNKVIEEICDQYLILPHDDVLVEIKTNSIDDMNEITYDQPSDYMLGGDSEISINHFIEKTCTEKLFQDDSLEEDKATSITVRDKYCEQQLPCDDMIGGATITSMNNTIEDTCDHQLRHDNVLVEDKDIFISNEDKITCNQHFDDMLGLTEISMNKVVEETCGQQLNLPQDDVLVEVKKTPIDNANEMICEQPSDDMLGEDPEISLTNAIEESCDQPLSLPHEDVIVEDKDIFISNEDKTSCEQPFDDMLAVTEISINKVVEETNDQPLSLPYDDVLIEDKDIFTSISNEDTTCCEQPFDDMFVGDKEISLNKVIEKISDQQLGLRHDDVLVEHKETSIDNSNVMICEQPSDDRLGGDPDISLNNVIEETCDQQLPQCDIVVKGKEPAIDNMNEMLLEQPSDDMLGGDAEISIKNVIEETCDQQSPHDDVLVEEDKDISTGNGDEVACEHQLTPDDVLGGDTEISINQDTVLNEITEIVKTILPKDCISQDTPTIPIHMAEEDTSTDNNKVIQESCSNNKSPNKIITDVTYIIQNAITDTELDSEIMRSSTKLLQKTDLESDSHSTRLTDITITGKGTDLSIIDIVPHLDVFPKDNNTEENQQTDTNDLTKSDSGNFEAIPKRVTLEKCSEDVHKEDTTTTCFIESVFEETGADLLPQESVLRENIETCVFYNETDSGYLTSTLKDLKEGTEIVANQAAEYSLVVMSPQHTRKDIISVLETGSDVLPMNDTIHRPMCAEYISSETLFLNKPLIEVQQTTVNENTDESGSKMFCSTDMQVKDVNNLSTETGSTVILEEQTLVGEAENGNNKLRKEPDKLDLLREVSNSTSISTVDLTTKNVEEMKDKDECDQINDLFSATNEAQLMTPSLEDVTTRTVNKTKSQQLDMFLSEDSLVLKPNSNLNVSPSCEKEEVSTLKSLFVEEMPFTEILSVSTKLFETEGPEIPTENNKSLLLESFIGHNEFKTKDTNPFDNILSATVLTDESLPRSCSATSFFAAISETGQQYAEINSNEGLAEAIIMTGMETSLSNNNSIIASATDYVQHNVFDPLLYKSESNLYQSMLSTNNDTVSDQKGNTFTKSQTYDYDMTQSNKTTLETESSLSLMGEISNNEENNHNFAARELYIQLIGNINKPTLNDINSNDRSHTFESNPETLKDPDGFCANANFTAQTNEQSQFDATYNLSSAVNYAYDIPAAAHAKSIHEKQHRNIATLIKEFIFANSNEYTINNENRQVDTKPVNEQDPFCFLTSFKNIGSDNSEKTSEKLVPFSENSASPEPGILSSATLNKRQESFTTDLSRVQLMKQRFENPSCGMYINNRNHPEEIQSSLATEKNIFIDSQLGNSTNDDIKMLDVCSNYSTLKNIWENNEHITPSEIDHYNHKLSFSRKEYITCMKSNENSSINNKQQDTALEETCSLSEMYMKENIERIPSVESEMLNKNLITVEQELGEVLNIESEEIDSEIQLEMAKIDAMDLLDNPKRKLNFKYINDQENSKLFLDVDEDQTDVLSIEDETMDLHIQQEITDIDSLPNPDIQGSNIEDNVTNIFQTSKKLIHVDSFMLDLDLSDDETGNLEEENTDDKLLEVSSVDTFLDDDKKLYDESEQKPPEGVCVVKPRLILIDPNLKDTSLIDDEELDDELQKELDEIDNMVQANPTDENERGSVELSSSAIGFFSTQLDVELVDSNKPSNFNLDGSSNLDSNLQDTINHQHDMNNYEFFKSSPSCMYNDDTTHNYYIHQNRFSSLEPSFDSLQSGLSGAGETFSDELAMFNENNLSMSTESDGSDFNAWSSNVEFGDPTETTDQEGMDFDSIISAPNLSEALKKLEAHIQDKGDDMQWLTARTPSPSLKSLEKYFKEGVSCFDTEKFYVEVSGGLITETNDTDSKVFLENSPCSPLEEMQVTPCEEQIECTYAPGSIEAKECETDNQESGSDNWIISPFQYPRVLLANTDQMSIIVEEDDQRKSQPPSPLQKCYQNISFSSEQSIEESHSEKHSKQTDTKAHVQKDVGEIDHTLEEFDRLINRPSVDESTTDVTGDDSEENLNQQKTLKNMSTKSDLQFDCIETGYHEMTYNSDTITDISDGDLQLKDYEEDKRNIETISNIQPFSNSYRIPSDNTDNKSLQEDSCNAKQESNVREEIKLLLEGNIDSITEDKLNQFSVTERTTFWDKKLQMIQELDTNTIPSTGPKSLSNIKSGTVQELVSCFAENNTNLEPSPCISKSQNHFPKTAGHANLNATSVDFQKNEGNTKTVLSSPLKEYTDGESVSVKPVLQWKAYWDDIITEQNNMSNKKEINKVHKIPSIQISDDGENNPVSTLNKPLKCDNNNVLKDSNSNYDYEISLHEEEDNTKSVLTKTSSTGSVLRNIKMFSECSILAHSSSEFKSRGNSSGFNTINSKENKFNSTNEEVNRNSTLLEPIFRPRSYSTGHIDKNIMASTENSEKCTQETNTSEDGSIEQQNEFRIRFERAKHFFKQLEISGPGEIKERDYRSMPRLDLVLPTNRKPSIDSDSGADVKPKKRRDRYRNKRKKTKYSSNIQSAPTSDTETAKRIQSKDSFDSFGGSVKITKVSERFHVKDLFRDVSGKVGLFRGIPNQAAVLASLKSVDDERAPSPYQMDYIDHRSASLGNIPAGFQNEYPYLPTTPVNQFRPRSALEFNLIPRCQLLDEDF